MKKLILAWILVAATLGISAQVTVYRLESSGTNPAYTVPDYILLDFKRVNPGVTEVEWTPADQMWKATFADNNRLTHLYYNNTGEAYRLVLPVISTYVPEEVVASALEHYGTSLYDITKMKAADHADVYQVRLLEQNNLRSVWMNADGVIITEGIYKMKTDDDKIKIKAEEGDRKIKVDEDGIKVKTDEEKTKTSIEKEDE